MKKLIIFFLLLFVVSIESYMTTVPIILSFLVALSVAKEKNFIFFCCFAAGFLFDALTLSAIGKTSSILLILLFLMYLYEKKLETRNVFFVFFAAFFSSLIFIFLQGFHFLFFGSLIAACFSASIFLLFSI